MSASNDGDCLSNSDNLDLSHVSKKPRLDSTLENSLIYIVEKKISAGHLSHLKGVAIKKGFSLASSVSENVTHIITTLPTFERLRSAMPCELPTTAEVVTLEWMTNSFAEGKPTQVTDRYRLRKTLQSHEGGVPMIASLNKGHVSPHKIAEYECQRATLLEHHNHMLTDALEVLEKYFQHLDHKQGDTRALAFRQASCSLKVLPGEVKDISQVADLPRIGKHSLQIIEDILSSRSSREVEKYKTDEWFQCMELFTSVYGCGSATAHKWYQKGLKSVQDIKTSKDLLQLTETQKLGLAYYEHLSAPVSREETEIIVAYIQLQLDICLPGTDVEAVGSYRRGKPHGHDVDLLLTHPDSCVTETILDTLLARLRKQNVLIHSDVSKGHNTASKAQFPHINIPGQQRTTFDHLDKAFCILCLQSSDHTMDKELSDCDEDSNYQHNIIIEPSKKADKSAKRTVNMIKRVDFIVSPPDQYPFALVSWTGSKQFNRSLRRYSAKELNMSVTAHGVYDISQQKYLPATTEKEVFTLLKLVYREPWERNC